MTRRAEDEDTAITQLGATIRLQRQRRGWSVQALAERAGVSFGMVSGLERGHGNPTYKALHRIAAALELPMTRLMMSDDLDDMVVRAEDRYVFPARTDEGSSDIHRELLTPRKRSALQVTRATLPVGYSRRDRPFRHLGTEVVVVESGRLLAGVGDREVLLEPGDAMTYSCSTNNWWANAAETETVVISALTPIER